MTKWYSFLIFVAISVYIEGVPLQETPTSSQILKILEKCNSDGGFTGIVNCAASRTLRMIERLDKNHVLEVMPGITLTSDETSRKGKELSASELPRDPTEKSSKLLDLLIEATTRFISSRTLKIKLPEAKPESLARALEEGRGKMKKMMGPFIFGLGAKMMTMIPLTMTGLALLATKALVVGKLAFAISLILLFQYILPKTVPLFGYNSYGTGTYYGYGTNNLGGWSGSQIPYAPYARSIDDVTDDNQEGTKSAQELAYSGHTQK